jgi:ESS family glutamate:Na+ symporter
MTTISTSAFSTWSLIIWFAIISFMMLLGNIIRRKVKYFRNLLFSTAIIAGFLGLGFKYLWFYLPDIMANLFNGYTSTFLEAVKANVVNFNEFLQIITYHALALGFIAMGLKTVKDAKTKKIKGKPIKSGLLIVNTYLLQGMLGLVFTIVLGYVYTSVAPYGGLLLPMGFGQGPGQANNIGSIFETNGFVGGQAFGLAIATIGFVWASIAGIYYINKRAKEGVLTRSSIYQQSAVSNQEVEASDEIPVSEAIDKLSVQIIFIFAMLFAILFKQGLKFITKKGWMKRKYTNEYMLNRLSGVLFDFMVVASLMSINIEALANTGLLVTLILMTSAGGIATYFYLIFTTRRIYPEYPHHAFATMFGNLTGTAPNGIALLREIDPNFETPAADDLVTGSSSAVMFGAPILILTGIIYLPEWYYLWGSFLALIVFFVIFNYFMLKGTKKTS